MANPGWHGSFEFAVDSARRWSIDGLQLYVARRADHWLVQRYMAGPEVPDGLVAGAEVPWEPGNATADVQRIHAGPVRPGSAATLVLEPRVADRAVVSRPHEPVIIGGGQTVRIFIGTPLWLALSVGGAVIDEFPVGTVRSTWFGRDTTRGELCWGARSHCRTDLAGVPVRAGRVMTALDVANHAASPWRLERIRMPVPHLSLYPGRDGRLWSSAMRTERADDGEVRSITIEAGAPPEAAGATPVSGPRTRTDAGLLMRLYGNLFEAR